MPIDKPHILNTTPLSSVTVRLLLAAGAILTAYYRLALPFLLLILCLSYLLWSYYWTRMSCRYIAGENMFSDERIFAGDTVTRAFKFTNRWILPLVRCGLHLTLPRQFAVHCHVPVTSSGEFDAANLSAPSGTLFPTWKRWEVNYAWLPDKQELTVNFQITALQRGLYYLPPVHITVGDPSGLYRGLKRVVEGQFWYVFPRITSGQALLKTFDFEEDRHEDNYGIEDEYDFQGVRNYELGDAFKHINWYSTARTGSLKTNLYQRKNAYRCLVALDLASAVQPAYAVHTRREEDRVLEETIGLAAGLALYHLEQGAATAFFTNAPLLHWEKAEKLNTGEPGAFQRRTRQITTLEFEAGVFQAQRILELCARIDDTGRALAEEQEALWLKMMCVPAGTLIYIIGYHTPPAYWTIDDTGSGRPARDPSHFYTRRKLSCLPSSRVRHWNMSAGGKRK